jgi:hypothetical protein
MYYLQVQYYLFWVRYSPKKAIIPVCNSILPPVCLLNISNP